MPEGIGRLEWWRGGGTRATDQMSVTSFSFSELATLTAVPLGLGSNPGEDMDVCKCIVPSRHEGTLNSRRAASPLMRLVEWEERWKAPDHPTGCSLSKLGVKPS
ncbi:uncharacterized protein TNCV_4144131 [Trichonephila clavipes]|uniref:Uncharacterized protein n=1 Tax=Trichonephila clavipes TaxID=2585209 RepID=A0A8X6V1L3_TRICX|nr:uncharacterized protein TNCV_4144131 [Trichonephila clavipes]